MNNKLLVIGLIAIIILSISVVFVSGEITAKQANVGFSLVYFHNLENQDFEIVIENSQEKTLVYELSYLVDDENVAEIQQTISSGKKKIIAAPEEVLDTLNKKTTGRLVVKVRWDDGNEEIWKYFAKKRFTKC